MFPVSVTGGVYRAGKGNERIVEVEFELVAAVVVAKEALLGEFGQGGANGGSAQAAELAQALNGDGGLLELEWVILNSKVAWQALFTG